MIGGLLAVTAALMSQAAVSTVPPAPPAAVVCSDVYMIAARGSGESASDADRGMGAPLGATFLRLAALAEAHGETIAGAGVDYPAVPIDGGLEGYLNSAALVLHLGGEFAASVDEGARSAAAQVTAMATQCPETRIVLGGYSQGASVVVGALELLPATVKTSIAAVLVFGDPGFDPTDTAAALGGYDPAYYGLLGPHASWSSLVDAPVFSYCHAGDHVCGISSEIVVPLGGGHQFDLLYRDVAHIVNFDVVHQVGAFEPHSTYDIEAPDAAARLVRVLTLSTPRAAITDEPVSTRAGPAPAPASPAGDAGAQLGGLLAALGVRAQRRSAQPHPVDPPRVTEVSLQRRHGRALPGFARPPARLPRPPRVPVRALARRV